MSERKQEKAMEKTTFILLLLCFIALEQTQAFSRSQRDKKTRSNRGTYERSFEARKLLFDTVLSDDSHTTARLREQDRITSLPGQPKHVAFNQYGGYVTVNETAGRALYYYFVEAQNATKNTPLLLWLNGGPGCSSLGYGAMEEIGPFRVYSDGKTLYTNEYAWNRVANVLFLESPAGVGFSYSNTTNDVKYGTDEITAVDNYVFLVKWLERFPDYKNKNFYIAGESYAGHYVPQLAKIILHRNIKAETTINLKGIIIGNAEINDETDNIGMYEYFGSHALISDDIANQIKKHCDFSPNATTSEECNASTKEANKIFDQIDIYNIYAPRCSNSSHKTTEVLEYDPCTDNYVKAYLNRRDVQKALHANVTSIPYDWKFCSDVNWTYVETTVLPHIKEFMDKGLRVWIYSGDVDGRVSVTTTQLALKTMNLSVKEDWRPWYVLGEVGGYTQDYVGNLKFATVRGAGHAVPSYRPEGAFSLITSFLNGKELPGNE